jgi:hypothetical protein
MVVGKEAAMRALDKRVRLFGGPLVLGLSLLAGGCASVFHGTRQTVEVFTDPPGAIATAGDQHVTTPGVLNLPRKIKSTQIRIEKEGFVAKTVVLERRTSGLVWLNFVGVPAGVIGGYSTANHNGILGGYNESITGGAAGAGGTAIGFLIDYGNGAAYRLDPAQVVVRLEPVSTSASRQALEMQPPAATALDPRINPFPDNNEIRNNVTLSNGANPDPKIAPLPGADLVWDFSGSGNCWANNVFQTSFPDTLPRCDGDARR